MRKCFLSLLNLSTKGSKMELHSIVIFNGRELILNGQKESQENYYSNKNEIATNDMNAQGIYHFISRNSHENHEMPWLSSEEWTPGYFHGHNWPPHFPFRPHGGLLPCHLPGRDLALAKLVRLYCSQYAPRSSCGRGDSFRLHKCHYYCCAALSLLAVCSPG